MFARAVGDVQVEADGGDGGALLGGGGEAASRADCDVAELVAGVMVGGEGDADEVTELEDIVCRLWRRP